MELTGFGQVLRGLGDIYLLFALVAIAIALYKPEGWKQKAIGTAIVVLVFGFIPAKNWIEKRQDDAFAREAWAYFKKLCAQKSGENIYRSQVGVKSVLVIKPLPPAAEKDLYDQFWYGDPYSNATAWDKRGKAVATTLTLDSSGPNGLQKGLEFVEFKEEIDGSKKYQRISRPTANDKMASVDNIESPVSKFGISWEDISSPEDRKYWIAGSRLRIIDLADNSVIAERIGYLIEAGFGSTAGQRRPWLSSRRSNSTCPPLTGGDYTDSWFVSKVLNQGKEK